VTANAFGQTKADTADILDKLNVSTKNKFINNIFQDAISSIRRNPGDTIDATKVLFEKSEARFQPYEGKIIRYILVEHFGFDKTFTDTSNRITYIGTRILNSLHTDTKEFIIRQNIFMKEDTKLSAYELADNERYLRTLDFIQDARIFVDPVEGTDSVDIIVITKDLFTLTGFVGISRLNSAEVRVAEANLAGIAQRVQLTGVWDEQRHPQTAYEVLYSKNNIGGSFINGTVIYSRVNGDRSEGPEEEDAFTIQLDRPLVSPFSHFAGGAQLSFNQSTNVYQKPVSGFYDYQYNLYDGWLGYNLGTKHFDDYKNYSGNRNRFFIAARYFQKDFLQSPSQIADRFDPIYNSKEAVLGQLTVFKQDFYKLNYFYGFGTTEDLPTGYSISLTGGWYKQLQLERPYGGFQLEHYLVTPRGGFVNASFKIGGFLHNGRIEDASTLASVNFFTRLFNVYRWKFRQYMKWSYTQLDNRVVYEPLRLNNDYGLVEFASDSVNGNKRISIYSESVLYTNKKILGFRFAPVVFGGFSLMSFENQPFKKSDIYTAVGAGVRTRNENLIFGTIELKAIYLPRTATNQTLFRVLLTSELQYRYKSRFVKAPNVIYLNRDDL
jgi:hypothetical protein